MKKLLRKLFKQAFLLITIGIFTFSSSGLFAQDVDIVNFPDKDGVRHLNSGIVLWIYFTMPQCTNYDLSELGLNIDATSGAGSVKMAIYSGEYSNATLLYESAEFQVTGGVDEYVSIAIPPGSLTIQGNTTYKVAVIGNPTSSDIRIDATTSPNNNGVATNLSINSFAISSGNSYPTFPDPLNHNLVWYRAFSPVVKGTAIAAATSVFTGSITNITQTSATANGYISCLGSPHPTAHGFCWNTTGNPTINDSYTDEGVPTSGSFSSSITGLTNLTTYYIRAYATNSTGTAYGDEVSFTAQDPPTDILKFPEMNGNQYVSATAARYNYFTMPNCTNYELAELGVNIASTSAAGYIKLGIYDGIEDTLLYETAELQVFGGVDQYVNAIIPTGNLILEGDKRYAVAIIANPVSGNIVTYGSPNPTHQGIGLNYNPSTSSWAIYWTVNYPTFPNPISFDGASYNFTSFVVTGHEHSSMNTSGVDTITACDSYTWINGQTYTSSNNTDTYTLTNAAGCDSVVTLNLTINYSVIHNADPVTACDSALIGGTWYYSSQLVTENFPNGTVDGCDSTVYTSLTIQESPTANAGVDATICEDVSHTLSGTATNHQSVMWSSSGDGSFDNATSLTATYTPGPNDIINGMATLTLTAVAIAPCSDNATDDMVITIQPLPTADAGLDGDVCEDDTYQLAGVATAYSSLLWTTSGDGSFDDATLLNAVYTPGPNDITTGSAILTLDAIAIGPCATNAMDDMALTIINLPTADAGPDDESCGFDAFVVSGTASNYQSVLWTTSGDGTFNDPTALSTTYTPGNNDLTNGSATLTFTAFAQTPCTNDAADDLILTLYGIPVVNAGSDGETCPEDAYQLSGTAQNAEYTIWNSTGDGTFDDPYLLNAMYTPGPIDIELGQVSIWLIGYPHPSCNIAEPMDEMILTISEAPDVFAGLDHPVVSGTTLKLFPDVSGGSGDYNYYWTPEDMVEDPTIPDPETLPIFATTHFVLEVTDNVLGCKATDTTTKRVEPGVNYQVSGTINDINSDGPLPNVYIYFSDIEDPAITDETGYYSIEVPSGYVGHSIHSYPAYVFDPDTNFYEYVGMDIQEDDVMGEQYMEAIANPDTICVNTGETAILDANVFSPAGTITYEWVDDEGNVISYGATMEVEPEMTTQYTIHIQDEEHYAWDTISVYVMTCTGLAEYEGGHAIKVYPNPTDDNVWLESTDFSGTLHVKLVNMNGRTIRNEKLETTMKQQRHKIKMEELPTGIYYLLVTNNKGQQLLGEKIIKVH